MTIGHNPLVPASPRCCKPALLQARVVAFGSQDLGFKTSINGHWVSLSRPGFQDFDIWHSGLGFQNLDKRTLGFTLRTWVSGLRYLALRTWVSRPRQTHKYRCNSLFISVNFVGKWEIYDVLLVLTGECEVGLERVGWEGERKRERNSAMQRILQLVESAVLGPRISYYPPLSSSSCLPSLPFSLFVFHSLFVLLLLLLLFLPLLSNKTNLRTVQCPFLCTP